MVDIRLLLFCNFTTAKLFNDCSRKAVFFGLYPLPARMMDNSCQNKDTMNDCTPKVCDFDVVNAMDVVKREEEIGLC
ncbi:hypothetical protein ACB092_05G208000 [Castanea dentata]